MIFDDIIDKINEAQYPSTLPEDMNIGIELITDGVRGNLFEFYPNNTCSAFSSIKRYQDDACVTVHTHGIDVTIDGIRVNIHNSQIIALDYYFFDDTVQYQKSDSRGARVGVGLLLAGPIGAAVGLASSFGKGNKHIVSHNLIISYWNIETMQKEIIELVDRKGVKDNIIPNLVECWKEQVKTNEDTGRKAWGDNMAGVGEAGCLGFIAPFIVAGGFSCYKIIEYLLC